MMTVATLGQQKSRVVTVAPNLCVRDWIMHLLPGKDVINGLAWTQKSAMLDENPDGWKFGIF